MQAARRGFTIIELVIAVVVLMVVLVPGGKLAMEVSSSFSSLPVLTHQASRSLVIMDRLVQELTAGNFSSLQPGAPVGADSVQFNKALGVQDGVCVYGDPIVIDAVLAEGTAIDGQDNDGDGLLDERRLRIWENRPPLGTSPGREDPVSILCENLTGEGLKVTREGAILSIELTLQAMQERDEPPVIFKLRSGVKMRNSE